jgi:hypothetical protein
MSEEKKVELTLRQKKIIVVYLLSGSTKGILEDCREFWDGVPPDQVDDLYPDYREAVEEYVERLRGRLKSDLLGRDE